MQNARHSMTMGLEVCPPTVEATRSKRRMESVTTGAGNVNSQSSSCPDTVPGTGAEHNLARAVGHPAVAVPPLDGAAAEAAAGVAADAVGHERVHRVEADAADGHGRGPVQLDPLALGVGLRGDPVRVMR